jgi:EEF1A lysine methyltransferase 4
MIIFPCMLVQILIFVHVYLMIFVHVYSVHREYWEERFAEEGEYEWLASWSSVSELLEQSLPPRESNPKILVVGCGNSEFSAGLYDAGWTDVTSIDFSEVVIQNMEQRNIDRAGMKASS